MIFEGRKRKRRNEECFDGKKRVFDEIKIDSCYYYILTH